ncbi:MAG: T9SS type A sorting domain-containing protein, partial [Bacteroidetes bacterium]|nr:T9SS type A sorting domain-containing protein [Bacteroidota bacterium]
TDLTGRVVSEGIASSNTFIFDRGSLSSGLYTYQIIQNNKAVANGKLVIQ